MRKAKAAGRNETTDAIICQVHATSPRYVPAEQRRLLISTDRKLLSRTILLRWVVPLCATGRPKWILNVRSEHKEAQKFTFARCSCARAERMSWWWYTGFVRFRSRRLSGILFPQESPGISAFFARARATFLRSARLYRWHSFARGMRKRRWRRGRRRGCDDSNEAVPLLRYRETRLIIPAVSQPPPSTRPSSLRLSLFQQMDLPLGYPLRRRFFSFVSPSWKPLPHCGAMQRAGIAFCFLRSFPASLTSDHCDLAPVPQIYTRKFRIDLITCVSRRNF